MAERPVSILNPTFAQPKQTNLPRVTWRKLLKECEIFYDNFFQKFLPTKNEILKYVYSKFIISSKKMQKIRRLFIVKRARVKNEISKRSMKKRKKSENEKKKN